MSKSWRFAWVAVWCVRAMVWYLAGCAITFMILAVPYLESDEQRQRRINDNEQRRANDPDAAAVSFIRRVLADTEDVWDDIFRAAGKRYEKPTLVLFTKATRSACGLAEAVTGPFYCPFDHRI